MGLPEFLVIIGILGAVLSPARSPALQEPEPPGANPPGEETTFQLDETLLRVMSFNAHHGRGTDDRVDLDRVARVIRESGADVVGLQEIDRGFHPRSGFRDQVALLASELNMQFAFATALLRPGPDGTSGSYGNAILSRYPIESFLELPLPKIGTREDRVLGAAVLNMGGSRVSFAVTHLGLSTKERISHVGTMMDFVDRLPPPRILVGDWNSMPDAPEVEAVKGYMTDAHAAVGADAPTFVPFTAPYPEQPKDRPEPPLGWRIDYIFVSPDIKVLEASVVPGDASDHRAVLATLALPRERPEGSQGPDPTRDPNQKPGRE